MVMDPYTPFTRSKIWIAFWVILIWTAIAIQKIHLFTRDFHCSI